MDIDALKLFLGIVGTGSFSRAALLARTTQSSISKRILALELALGHRLFERTGRGARLTEAGRLLVGPAQALVGDAENLADTLRAQMTQPQGLVRVGIQASVAWPLVLHLHQQLRRDYPLIRLRVAEAPTRQIVEWMQDGRIDIALVSEWGQEELPQVEPLFTCALVLVGPRGDALTAQSTVAFSRLAGLPLILSPVPNGPRLLLEEAARLQGFELDVVMEGHSIHLIKRMVRDGAGYTVSLRASVREELADGSLRAARITAPDLSQKFYLSVTNLRKTSGATATVAGLLRTLGPRVAGARVLQGAASAAPARARTARLTGA